MDLSSRLPVVVRTAVAGGIAAALLLAAAAPAHAQARKKKGEAAALSPPPSSPTRIQDEEDFGPRTESETRQAVVVATAPRRYHFGRGQILVGVRVGAALPEVVSNFGPSFIVGAEVGWVLPRLPLIGDGLAVTVDFAYSQPEAGGNGTSTAAIDPGTYKWSVTQREASLGFTVLYRVPFLMQGRLVPYVGIGPRLFMLSTSSTVQPGGNAVASFTETSNHAGMGLPFGADYKLGPGRIFLEAMFLYAPFNHNSTGATNAGALTIEAGYRMLFGLGG